MLKRFFLYVLGTITGFWLSIIILFFVLIIIGAGVIGTLIGSTETTSKIESGSILYLKLEGTVTEHHQDQTLVEMIRSIDNNSPALSDMVTAVREAAKDSKIDGIYIDAAGASMGVASRQELIEALKDFKQSGKWIYAYADNFAQGDYLVSSVADKIYLNPVGNVDIRGVGMQTPFFTGLLDKLGIKVQVVKVGTYKSAVEPFILTSMSEAARRQNSIYIDSIWNYYAETIGDARSVGASTVSAWADSLTFAWTAEKDVESKIISETLYRRNVEDMMRELTGRDKDEDLRLVTPAEYVASMKTPSSDKSHIAVLYAVGDIVDSGEGGIAGDRMVPEIISLADDENVAGLVFRVNSGGGSAFASEQIWEALEYFKSTGKPYYVSMGDYAASGGFYISCGADSIFADATTLTGSIGVFGLIPDFSGLVTDKLGVTFSTVASSPNATFMSLTEPMTPQQAASMQRYVEDTYNIFTTRVADGRHMSVDSVKAIAEGRVWVGSTALEIGLVDALGNLNDAVTAMAEATGLEADNVVTYPRFSDKLIDKIMEETSRMAETKGIVLDKETIRYLLIVKRLRDMSPVQARMPEFVID